MPRARPWFFALAGLIILVLLALAGFIRPIRDGVRWIFLPVVRMTAGIGSSLGSIVIFDEEAKSARDRIQELEARLETQSIDYVRLRALEEENRSLRSLANFITETGYRTIGAHVISRAIQFQTATVTIDRGVSDGVQIGQAVISEGGLYVGKIIDVDERVSVIRLFTDANGRTAAKVVGSEIVNGIIEGRGNGVAHFTLVPQAVPLERDDVIVTAGTEEKVPANLVIGLVNDVEAKETDPFKNAAIEPLASIDQLNLVSVIIPGSL